MRVLFISQELIAAGLCPLLKQDGHDVRLYIEEESLRDCYSGFVNKTENWHRELQWVGKDGLIIFDDIGFGVEQDRLRLEGYRVVGGSALGDRLEGDRFYGQEIFGRFGLREIPSFNFDSAEIAIQHVDAFPDVQWVVKRNGSNHLSVFNYVGQLSDGRDVKNVLRRYINMENCSIHLQKKIVGVEIGVGRYFNGEDWVGPIEMNIEHKSLMQNGVGPATPEMGTLMWYDSNESNLLFQETLAKLKSYLHDIDFRGDFDINCIVNSEGAWPLEATARFGTPSTAMQAELHISPWGDFLGAIADKQEYRLQFRKGYGIVVTIAIPPFPYQFLSKEYASNDLEIYFRDPVTEDDMRRHYFFEEVAREKDSIGEWRYIVKGHKGCVVHVTGFGGTIVEAREAAYSRVRNIVVPKMFYREDIGLNFLQKDFDLLKKWGWIDKV